MFLLVIQILRKSIISTLGEVSSPVYCALSLILSIFRNISFLTCDVLILRVCNPVKATCTQSKWHWKMGECWPFPKLVRALQQPLGGLGSSRDSQQIMREATAVLQCAEL